MKRYFADTTAMIVFSTLLGAFVEVVLTGLEPIQSLRIRLAAIPLMVITGRPYGIYRDILFRRLEGELSGRLQSMLIDTFANATFQVPLYLLLLAWAGASLRQTVVAATSILIIAGISGRPYGVFLTYWRKMFSVPRVQ